jgi:hypothetical protein
MYSNIPAEVAVDLIKFINSLKGIEKTAKVNYKTSKGVTEFMYTPLDDLLEEVKKNNDFAVIQPMGQDEHGRKAVKTLIIHKSGHIIQSGWYPINGADRMQDEGAEITYKKRYSLAACLGISSDEDTDGNDEQGEYAGKKKKPTTTGKPATSSQKILIKKIYGDNYKAIIEDRGWSTETLTIEQASQLIAEGQEKCK